MSGPNGTNGGNPGYIRFGDEPWQETRIEIITAMVRAWWARNQRNFGQEHAKAMQALSGGDTTGDDNSGGES